MSVLKHLVLTWEMVNDIEVLLLSEKVEPCHRLLGIEFGSSSRIDHHITLVVDHRIELLGRQSKEITYLIGE